MTNNFTIQQKNITFVVFLPIGKRFTDRFIVTAVLRLETGVDPSPFIKI